MGNVLQVIHIGY